jgi:hypothetical protein
VDLAARLYERSALLGDLTAKDELVKLYASERDARWARVRAAALLAIEPRSETQALTLQSISREFGAEEKKSYLDRVEFLRKRQAALVEKHLAEIEIK